MSDEPNGLASMTKARERRARRTMPPPRHPIPASAAEPTTDAEPAAQSVEEEESGPPAITTFPAVQNSDLNPSSTPARPSETPVEIVTLSQEVPVETGERPSRPVTLYLEETHIDFLEEARIAGLTSRPRLDVSKSAVVRLALRRLQQQMTIEDIRDYLKAQPTDSTKTGRKRR